MIIFFLPMLEENKMFSFALCHLGILFVGSTELGLGSYKQYEKTYGLIEKYEPKSKTKIESKLKAYCDIVGHKAACIDFSKKSLPD